MKSVSGMIPRRQTFLLHWLHANRCRAGLFGLEAVSQRRGVGKLCGFGEKYLDEAYVFGEVADQLVESLQTNGIRARACVDLKDAVRRAYDSSEEKTNVLFSPGFPVLISLKISRKEEIFRTDCFGFEESRI